MKNRILRTFKSIGPAFILASVVLGPGSIAVASSIGSTAGFSLLWVVVIAGISMVAYTSMAARFGIVSEDSFLQTVSNKYSKGFALSIGLATFFAASSWQFGNNLGIGIAMNSLTDINEAIWPMIFTSIGIVLIFFAKDLYKVLEKIMMAMVMLIIVAFVITLFLIKPDISSIASGLVPHSFSFGNEAFIAALVATTFSLPTAMYQSYLVKDKNWKIDEIRNGQNSATMGIFMLCLITMMIIITAAAALQPKGIEVKSAADMAVQLEVLFGSYAKYVFSIGLCAASFSSLMVNAVIGGGVLSDSLGLGRSMNEKMPRIFTIAILIIGMLIAVFFKGNLVYALIMAQASSIIGVPLIAIAILLVLNNKGIMGKYINSKLENIIGVFGLLLISIMVYYMIGKLIGFFGQI